MAKETRGGGAPLPGSVRGLRWVLFVVLLLAAAAVLLVEPALPPAGPAARLASGAAAVLLGAFVAGFAAYRFLLVRAGRYPAGKAFVQVGLVLAVVSVAIGLALERRRAVPAPAGVDLARPLASNDPDARAMAAELARHRERAVAVRLVPRLIELLDDPAPEVRRQARASLVALAGRDAGGDGAGAPERWRAWWRDRLPGGERTR